MACCALLVDVGFLARDSGEFGITRVLEVAAPKLVDPSDQFVGPLDRLPGFLNPASGLIACIRQLEKTRARSGERLHCFSKSFCVADTDLDDLHLQIIFRSESQVN